MRSAVAAWVLTGVCLAVPAWAQVVGVAVTECEAALTLGWPQPATVEVARTDREIALRFDQPVQFDAFAAALPRVSAWVAGAFFGYDSLVLTLVPGAAASAESRDGKVHVRLWRAEAGPVSPPPSDEARKRLRQLKANLLWSKGDAAAALDLLADLLRDYPDDKELLAARGMVATRLDLWRLAAGLVADAQPAAKARPRHWPLRGNEHAPRLTVTALADTQAGVGDRAGVRAAGHTLWTDGLRAGATYEGAAVRAAPGQWLSQAGFSDRQRHQGQVHLRFDALNGHWCSARAGVAEASPTLGAECAVWSILGASTLSAAWDEPRWDLPVFAGLGVVRRGVQLSQSIRSLGSVSRSVAGEVTGRLGVGLESWRAGAALAGFAAQGLLQYVSWRARPRWTAAWTFQHFQPTGDSGPGALAQVLPRFHLHNLVAGVQWNLWQWLTIDAYGGYGLSLWGPNALQFGGGIAWAPASGVQANLRVQQGLVPAAVGSTSTALFAQVGHAW